MGIDSRIRDGRRIRCRSLVGMDVLVQQDFSDDAMARAPCPDVKVRSDDDGLAIWFGFTRSNLQS